MPASESKTTGGFASRGTAVLSSPRLLPVEASERFLQALRMAWFRQSRDDSSQQIPYHGGGALSPSSRATISYQPVAASGRGFFYGTGGHTGGEIGKRSGDSLRPEGGAAEGKGRGRQHHLLD
jgi:hypothetical protein